MIAFLPDGSRRGPDDWPRCHQSSSNPEYALALWPGGNGYTSGPQKVRFLGSEWELHHGSYLIHNREYAAVATWTSDPAGPEFHDSTTLDGPWRSYQG
ncbi:hypothetical protein [Glycomyces xiaoerkulensis]|uniref:hypothetical protein n=1 Tax=Glycomyces xiaoerkulensis TaxID=2038139 RepID=UPI0012FFF929|nr:hypothetical protein [Glycomyces xiaoerkulensis]